MNIVNRLFNKSETDDISKSLGNMILSGVRNDGMEKIEKELIASVLNHNRTLICFDNNVTIDRHNALLSFLSTKFGSKKVYDIALAGSSDQIDVLSAIDTARNKSLFLVQLISSVSEMTEAIKSKMQRLFFYTMDALDRLGRTYKLNDMTKIDLDYAIDRTNDIDGIIDEPEKNKRLRFLTDSTTYSAFFEMESCWEALNILGLDDALSGTQNPLDVFANGNVVLVNGFASEKKENREAYLNAVITVLNHIIEKVTSTCGASILLKNSDFLSIEAVTELFDKGNTIDSKVYMFVEDISNYINKYGNMVLEDTKSFMIFTQGSDNNAAFWSSFFGSMDVREVSYSYTTKKKRGFGLFPNSYNTGGTVASSGRNTPSSQNVQMVNKPIYRPEIFRELKAKDVMIYLREPLIRRKQRIE